MKITRNQIRRKINKALLRKMILKEMRTMPGQGVGSFYKTAAGSMFDKMLGVQGLMDELEEAASNLRRIKNVALQCLSETQVDAIEGYVDDQHSFDVFQDMIEQCDRAISELDYQKFLS